MSTIRLSKRQTEILRLVKAEGPITGDEIGHHFNLSRATLRPDLAILTMAGLLDARPRVGYFDPGPKARSFVAEQLDTIQVKSVKAMPIVIELGKSVYEATVTLFLEDVSTLFIVDSEGDFQGILTSKDLLKTAIGKNELKNMPVEVVMTRFPQVIWVEETAAVTEALEKLQQSQVSCLPVLKDGNRPTGRFDLGIVLKLLEEIAQGRFEEGIYE